VGIHRLLNPSFCFLNTTTAITWQQIRTARMLEAEWWQVCGVAWVRGQRKVSKVLGAFGLLDFTLLRPVLAWGTFWKLRTVFFLSFSIFFSGRGRPRIRGSAVLMICCACSCTQYRLHTQYMLLTHADDLLCLQLHTVRSAYTVHASDPCWWLAMPTAAHSTVSII
jgi:hypothetical protein